MDAVLLTERCVRNLPTLVTGRQANSPKAYRHLYHRHVGGQEQHIRAVQLATTAHVHTSTITDTCNSRHLPPTG